MFSAETELHLKRAIMSEHHNAVEQYGATYESKKIADEVLQEEVDEVNAEIMYINNFMKFTNKVELLKPRVLNAMKELAQVYAVCMKIEYTEHKKNEK